MAELVSNIGIKLPAYKESLAKIQADYPEADPFIVQGEASRQMLEPILQGLSNRLSSDAFGQLKTHYNKISAIENETDRAKAYNDTYQTWSSDLFANFEDKQSWADKAEVAILGSLGGANTFGPMSIKSPQKLLELAAGDAATSLVASRGAQAFKETQASLTRGAADVAARFGASNLTIQSLLGTADTTANEAARIKIPQEYTDAKVTMPEEFTPKAIYKSVEALLDPEILTATLVGGTPSVVGMGLTAMNPVVGGAYAAVAFGGTSGGDKFGEVYDKVLEQTGDPAQAIRLANTASMYTGGFNAGVEYASDVFQVGVLGKFFSKVPKFAAEKVTKGMALKTFARAIGAGSIDYAKVQLAEGAEEVTSALATAYADQLIFEDFITKNKESIKTLREKGFTDQADALTKNLKYFEDAGDISQVPIKDILQETAKQTGPFALLGFAGGAKTSLKTKPIRTDSQAVVEDVATINQAFATEFKKIDKSLGSKEVKAQKKADLTLKTNAAVAFRVNFTAKNPNADISMISDTAKEADRIFSPNSTATVKEKQDFITTFEKVFGNGQVGEMNYQAFGDIGSLITVDALKNGNINKVGTIDPDRQIIVQDEMKPFLQAEKQTAEKEAKEEASTGIEKESVLALEEFSKTKVEGPRLVQSLDTLAADLGTSKSLTDNLRKSTQNYSVDELGLIKKLKFTNESVKPAVETIIKERKDTERLQGSITTAADRAITQLGKKEQNATTKDAIAKLTKLRDKGHNNNPIKAQATLDEIKALANGTSITLAQGNLDDKKTQAVNDIQNSIKSLQVDYLAARNEVLDATKSIHNGKALDQLSLTELSLMKHAIKNLSSELNVDVNAKKFTTEVMAAISDAGLEGTQLSRDLQSRLENSSMKDRPRVVSVIKKMLKSRSQNVANYSPINDLRKLGVGGVTNLTTRNLNKIRKQIASVLDNKNVDIKSISITIRNITNKVALMTETPESLALLDIMNDASVKADARLAKTQQDAFINTQSNSLLSRARDHINRIYATISSPEFAARAEDAGIGVDLPSIDEDIRTLRDLTDSIDYTMQNSDPTTFDATYRDIMGQVAEINAKYSKAIEEVRKAEQAQAAEQAEVQKAEEAQKKADAKKKVKESPTTTTESTQQTATEQNTTEQNTTEQTTGGDQVTVNGDEALGNTPASAPIASLPDTVVSNGIKTIGLEKGVVSARVNVLLRRLFMHTGGFFRKNIADEYQNDRSPMPIYRIGVDVLQRARRLTHEGSKQRAKYDAILAYKEPKLAEYDAEYARFDETARYGMPELLDLINRGNKVALDVYIRKYGDTEQGISKVLYALNEDYITGIADYRVELLQDTVYAQAKATDSKADPKLWEHLQSLSDFLSYEVAGRAYRRSVRRQAEIEITLGMADQVHARLVEAAKSINRLLSEIEPNQSINPNKLKEFNTVLDDFFQLRNALTGHYGITLENEQFSVENEDDVTFDQSSISPTRVTDANSSVGTKVVAKWFKQMTRDFKGLALDNVEILDKAPENVSPDALGRVHTNPETGVRGVQVFADRITSKTSLDELLRHESFGHRFLPAILGQKVWGDLVKYVEARGGIGGQSLNAIEKLYAANGVKLSRQEAILEAIAFHVQSRENVNPKKLTMWRKVFDAVNNFFRKFTGKGRSDQYIDNMLRQAFDVYVNTPEQASVTVQNTEKLMKIITSKEFGGPITAPDVDQFAVVDKFVKQTVDDFYKLDFATPNNNDTDGVIVDLDKFMSTKYGAPKGSLPVSDYLTGANSAVMDQLIVDNPELKAPMKAMKSRYDKIMADRFDESRIYNQRAGKYSTQVINALRGMNPQETKVMAESKWNRFITKTSNAAMGFKRLISMGAKFSRYVTDDGTTVTNVKDSASNLMASFYANTSNVFQSALGMVDSNVGSNGIFSPFTEVETYIKDGKTKHRMFRRQISNQDITTRLGKYLAIEGESSEASRIRFLGHLTTLGQIEAMAQGRISNANYAALIADKRKIEAEYDQKGLRPPVEEVLELYKDLAIFMQQSGQFTQAEVSAMRNRKSVHLGSQGASVTSGVKKGSEVRTGIDSILSEMKSIFNRGTRHDFHSKLTRIITDIKNSGNNDVKSISSFATDAEVLDLVTTTSSAISINDAIDIFNKSGSGVYVYRFVNNGYAQNIIVRDESTWDAITTFIKANAPTNLDSNMALSMVTEIARGFAKIKRGAIIYEPSFWVKNVWTDMLANYMLGYSDAGSIAKMMTNAEARREVRTEQFIMGSFDASEFSGENRAKNIKLTRRAEEYFKKNPDNFVHSAGGVALKAGGVFESILGVTEAVGRTAVVDSYIAQNYDFIYANGITESESRRRYAAVATEAHARSRDTMNFAQRGSWDKLNTALSLAPFARSSITALEKGSRVLGEVFADPVQRVKFMRRMSALTALVAMYSMSSSDDEWYQNLPTYIKETYWVIPTGGGKYIHIPKGFGAPALISNIVESVINVAKNDDPALAEAIVKGLFENISPNVIGARELVQKAAMVMGIEDFNPSMSLAPELANVTVQFLMNQDYFKNQDIADSYITNRHRNYRFNESDPNWAKGLSQSTGIPAAHFVFLMDSTIGSRSYRFATAALEGGDFVAPLYDRFVKSEGATLRGVQDWYYKVRDDVQTKADALTRLHDSKEYKNAPMLERKSLEASLLDFDPNFLAKMNAIKNLEKWRKQQDKLLQNLPDYNKMSSQEKMELRGHIYKRYSDLKKQFRIYDASK